MLVQLQHRTHQNFMKDLPSEKIKYQIGQIVKILNTTINAAQWNKLEEILSGLMLEAYIKGEQQGKKNKKSS